MRVAPNPSSPYATADPEFRHIVPVMPLLGPPLPDVLAHTLCDELAVMPDKLAGVPTGNLPDGLCPACVAALQGAAVEDERPLTDCQLCTSCTRHGQWCALCRMELHGALVAARRAAP